VGIRTRSAATSHAGGAAPGLKAVDGNFPAWRIEGKERRERIAATSACKTDGCCLARSIWPLPYARAKASRAGASGFEQFDHLGRFRTTEPVLDVAATARNGAR
jgi:hypothetical protein